MKKCIVCKQPIIHHMNLQIEYPVTMQDMTRKGMIYSDNGYMEYKISQLCEVCFDETTLIPKELEEYRNKYVKNHQHNELNEV